MQLPHYLRPSEWPHWPPSWTLSAGKPSDSAGLLSGCAQKNRSAHQKNKSKNNNGCSVVLHMLANGPQSWGPRPGVSYFSYTAQIVALKVVPRLWWEVVRCPALVWVAIVILHDVLPWHCDRRQGEAGWWRHSGHVHRRHFWLEAKLVVWQLKGETGLCS